MRAQERQAFIYHAAYDLYTRFPFQAHLYGLPSSSSARASWSSSRRSSGARATASHRRSALLREQLAANVDAFGAQLVAAAGLWFLVVALRHDTTLVIVWA